MILKAAFSWLLGPIGKYVIAGVVLAGLLWYVNHSWNSYKGSLIAQGIAICQDRHAAEIQRMNDDLYREKRERMLDREQSTAAIRDAEEGKLAALRSAQQLQRELTRGNTSACVNTGLSADFGLQFNEAAAAFNN